MSIWLWIYLVQAVIVTLVATRICFKLREPYEGPGDSLWLGMLIGFLWPVALIVFIALAIPNLVFHGIGRVITFGLR